MSSKAEVDALNRIANALERIADALSVVNGNDAHGQRRVAVHVIGKLDVTGAVGTTTTVYEPDEPI